jgi:hypothetical protein
MPMAKPAPKWSLPLGSRQQCVAGNNAPRGTVVVSYPTLMPFRRRGNSRCMKAKDLCYLTT